MRYVSVNHLGIIVRSDVCFIGSNLKRLFINTL
jgi:hypothetical protein